MPLARGFVPHSVPTMRHSLDFTVTPRDLLEIAIGPARWHVAAFWVIAVVGDVVLAASGNYLPFFTLSAGVLTAFLCGVVAVWRPRVGARIDDRGVSIGSAEPIESKKYRQYMYVPWSSFAISGSATESAHHFWLRSAHGPLWIPKRAFSSDAELVAFRKLLADNLGDRCKSANASHPARSSLAQQMVESKGNKDAYSN